jgi:hypothetical protein
MAPSPAPIYRPTLGVSRVRTGRRGCSRGLRSAVCTSASRDGRDVRARPEPERPLEKVLGAVTEFLVRAPARLLVDKVLAPLYADADDCGPGRYRDASTGACVRMCAEGYVWDAETKACKLVVTTVGGVKTVVSAHVPAVGRPPPNHGLASRPPMPPAPLPASSSNVSIADRVVRWIINRIIFPSGKSEEDCAVGFFYDPRTRRCTPVCGPGCVFDPGTKRCVKVKAALRR